ncbi:MAG: hypothetical protein KY468_03430 [Armatimonadetes bacterium]|nr:hypothetical protein [Armatimonadota bacterium]
MSAIDDTPAPPGRVSWLRRLKDRWEQFRKESPEDAEAEAKKAEAVNALIEQVATWVDRRRLETPALLFLETHKPFAYLGSQFFLVAMPTVAPLFGLQRAEQLYALMEKSENVDRLIQRIEELVEAR